MAVIVDSTPMTSLRPAAFAMLLWSHCLAPHGVLAQHSAQATPDHTGTEQTGPAEASTPAPFPVDEAASLAQRIHALLSAPNVANAHWGIAVTAMDGTPLFGVEEAKLFHPASTQKLFTTAAAMEILGPEATVTTTLTGDLDPATGVLKGDLVLTGAGDPSFNTNDLPYRRPNTDTVAGNDLAAFADQLVAKGLHRVTGGVLGVDHLLSHEPAPEGWAADDLLWGYGALPSALSVSDNELRLTITPGAAPLSADPAVAAGTHVEIEQLAPYLPVENRVQTVPGSAQGERGIGVVAVPDRPEALSVYGVVTAGTASIVEHVAIPEPAHYAAEALKQLLVARGVAVEGEARAFHALTEPTEPYLAAWRRRDQFDRAPGDLQGYSSSCGAAAFSQNLLASKVSAPLHDEITFTLKTSANLHAELLLRRLGLRNSCPGSAAVNGARLIRSYLVHAGLAPGDFVFYDGSGLSTKDLVTPRAQVQLLAYAARQTWFAQWKAALPVGGVDGTLAARFTQPPLKGHVMAKTGTLGESRALAGYVLCRSGREVIFSILVDNHLPGSSADRTAMDAIVAAIAAAN